MEITGPLSIWRVSPLLFKKTNLLPCYISPNSPSYLYSNHTKSIDFVLSKFNNNFKMLVMGNFNLSNVYMFSNSNGFQFYGTHSESAGIDFDYFYFKWI